MRKSRWTWAWGLAYSWAGDRTPPRQPPDDLNTPAAFRAPTLERSEPLPPYVERDKFAVRHCDRRTTCLSPSRLSHSTAPLMARPLRRPSPPGLSRGVPHGHYRPALRGSQGARGLAAQVLRCRPPPGQPAGMWASVSWGRRPVCVGGALSLIPGGSARLVIVRDGSVTNGFACDVLRAVCVPHA